MNRLGQVTKVYDLGIISCTMTMCLMIMGLC